MNPNVYLQLLESKKAGRPLFTVLIDPDKVDAKSLEHLIGLGLEAKVDYFFVGGSLVISKSSLQHPSHLISRISIAGVQIRRRLTILVFDIRPQPRITHWAARY
jgi:heptaprenylglyceryl phosphate synthase